MRSAPCSVAPWPRVARSVVKRVFLRFGRADRSRALRSRVAGIGLALCAREWRELVSRFALASGGIWSRALRSRVAGYSNASITGRTSARSRSGSVPVLANTWPQTASGGRRLRDDWVHRKKASVDCEQLVAAAAQIHLVTENHSPAAIHLSNLRTVLPAREDSLLARISTTRGNAPVATARRAAAALSYPFDSSTTSFCAPAKVRGVLSFRSILRRFLLRKRQRTAGDSMSRASNVNMCAAQAAVPLAQQCVVHVTRHSLARRCKPRPGAKCALKRGCSKKTSP